MLPLAVTALLAGPLRLYAQLPADSGQHGFQAALGGRDGALAVSCAGCDDSRANAGAFLVRFGAAMDRKVVLGGEGDVWLHEEPAGQVSVTWVNLVAQVYPSPAGGLFVTSGLGFVGITADEDLGSLGTAHLEMMSPGLILGAGYDSAITSHIAFTPFVDFLQAFRGDAKVNGARTGVRLGATMVESGLSLSWR